MRFLSILLWIVIAVLVTFLAIENWRDVTINLWGDLQADIKIPLLLAITFLIGFVPAYVSYRTRLWRLRRQAPVARSADRKVPGEEDEEPE